MTPATAAITAPALKAKPPADPEPSPSWSALSASPVEEEPPVVEAVAEAVPEEDWVGFVVVEEPWTEALPQ